MLYINDRLFDKDASTLAGEINSLPAWRREIVLHYKHELGQRQSLMAYQLLCEGLRRDYGIDAMPRFEIGEHGKPHLPDYPQLHFNLSHCREAVACAIDTRPVGIDIESYRPLKNGVLRYAMNEEEIVRIQAAPNPERAFTILWTQKEALVKLTGEGITKDIHNILDRHPYQLQTLVTQRYVCTLATE